MSTSAQQVARLLVAIPYLQARQGISLEEAARALGTTPQQLRKDLQVALFCGLPGGMPNDLFEVDLDAIDDGVVLLGNAEVLAKPLRLTPDEALTLLAAVQTVREVASPDTYPVIDSTVAKLQRLSTAEGEVLVSVAAGQEETRAQVTEAIARGQRLRLTYDGQSRGETTYPVVDPVTLSLRDGYVYLEAWSLDRCGWRTYLLDRLVAAEPTGERVVDHGPPPSRPDWLRAAGAAEVVLRLAPEATWLAEYVPVQSRRGTAEGLEVTILVADPAWLRRLLLRLGGGAEVVSPRGAADSAVRAARDALAAYQAAGLAGDQAGR
ncbi:MAG: WYL domain-containing protein [Actinomycetia bacterium]|nr:WYL domain-containing protein [Actinomycetes bacterium]